MTKENFGGLGIRSTIGRTPRLPIQTLLRAEWSRPITGIFRAHTEEQTRVGMVEAHYWDRAGPALVQTWLLVQPSRKPKPQVLQQLVPYRGTARDD